MTDKGSQNGHQPPGKASRTKRNPSGLRFSNIEKGKVWGVLRRTKDLARKMPNGFAASGKRPKYIGTKPTYTLPQGGGMHKYMYMVEKKSALASKRHLSSSDKHGGKLSMATLQLPCICQEPWSSWNHKHNVFGTNASKKPTHCENIVWKLQMHFDFVHATHLDFSLHLAIFRGRGKNKQRM